MASYRKNYFGKTKFHRKRKILAETFKKLVLIVSFLNIEYEQAKNLGAKKPEFPNNPNLNLNLDFMPNSNSILRT